MPYKRTLRRAINEDLVEQIEASGSVSRPMRTKWMAARFQGEADNTGNERWHPRPSATYRGARRNARRYAHDHQPAVRRRDHPADQ